MTKYIYGIGGQKARAGRIPMIQIPQDTQKGDARDYINTYTLHEWKPRWWQVRGIFLWALAAALAALVAA